MATLQDQLSEAQAALHDLSIGKGVTLVRDSDGTEVRYTQANRADLIGYIQSLQNQINAAAGTPSYPAGPLRFFF